MKRPNFFIVGAPKSGTTALAQYLSEHPQIFFCPEKEPNYFCEDFPGIRRVTTEEEYLHLFRKATDRHLAVGEGSIRYMYSEVAIQRLHDFDPDAKLIILVRNPVDLVYSFHSQTLYSLYEDQSDFRVAWELQAARANGERIPRYCAEPALLQYRSVGMVGKQVERVLSIFPREQVHIRLFDDFSADTKGVYEGVLAFLEVASDHRNTFPRVNESKTLRSTRVARVTERPPHVWIKLRKFLHWTCGIDRIGAFDGLRKWNAVAQPRAPLEPSMRRALIDEFRDDIVLLSKLVERDLSAWLTTSSTEKRASTGKTTPQDVDTRSGHTTG